MGPKRGRQYDIAGVLQSGHPWRQVQEALLLCRAVTEQFRQLCKIDRHLARASSIVRKPVSARAFNPRSTRRFWLAWHAASIGQAAMQHSTINRSGSGAPDHAWDGGPAQHHRFVEASGH